MRKAAFILTGAFVAAAALSVAADADVSGKWKMTSKGPRGERTSEIVLAQSGETLTVTTKDRNGNEMKSEGTVKGSDVNWTVKRQTPNGERVITFKGKIDGKTMSGTTEGGMGSSEWKAEKIEQ